jgi:DNA ligase-4
LSHEIAKLKARKVGEAPICHQNAARETFLRWVGALRQKYSPLPQHTTSIIFLLLYPEEDCWRKYDMKETRLAQQVASVLGVADLERGSRLNDWKGEDGTGCLGKEVEVVMSSTAAVCIHSILLHSIK